MNIMKLGNARDGNDATSLTARLEQTRRRKKRLEKYRFVLRRPQRSWKSWTTEEVEKLLEKIEGDDDVQNVYHTMV